MPNPSTPRGTCHDCNANGGAPAGMAWAVVCLRPQDSGKDVSRMPEVGCAWWQQKLDCSAMNIPGQIEPVEQELLTDLARGLDLQPGDIVCEFGAYFGLSTSCLVRGLGAARSWPVLHTFDVFSCAKDGLYAPYVRYHAKKAELTHLLKETPDRIDWLAAFDECMKGTPAGLMVRHQGQIQNAKHPGGRIVMMHIDAPKMVEEYLQLLHTFGPHTDAGTIIVFQDYFLQWSATVIAAIQIMIERGMIEPVESAASSLMVRQLLRLDTTSIEAVEAAYRTTPTLGLVERAIDTMQKIPMESRGRFLPRLALAGCQFAMEAGDRVAGAAWLHSALGDKFTVQAVSDLSDLLRNEFSMRKLYDRDTLGA